MEVVDKESLRAVRILNSEVHILNLTEILKIVEHWIDNPDGRCRQIVVTGFHGLWEGYRDPELRAILNGADLWVPDGIAPVAIARMRGYRNVVRTPGVEIMKEFLGLADREGHSSYFYGDTDDTLDRMRKHLEERYPGHRVAGTFSPPFRILSASEDDTVTARINASEPDIVWVGLGMPKQDRWAYEHKIRLNAKIVVGVGAAFAFLAGKVKRVPRWIGDSGLEWVWRFAMEPRKLWRRDLMDGPRFLYCVARELVNKKGTYDRGLPSKNDSE